MDLGAELCEPAPMTVRALFPTLLYQAELAEDRNWPALMDELAAAVRMLADEDHAGRAWCRSNGYPGYTSYASLDDLPTRASAFADLRRVLDRHAAAFARELHFDPGRRLKLDSLWVNVLDPKGAHSGHIHPHSAISGTVYLETPPGSGALKLEDPRLPLMMAAPSLAPDAPEDRRRFVYLQPEPGRLYLWESWLRHEVTPNGARRPRISVSFNYA
jgi:uncharacterized protein (TIGR02466 family)